MSFWERLKDDNRVKFRAGLTISAAKTSDGRWQLGVAIRGAPEDYVLLGLHFCTHILALYPEGRSRGYDPAQELQRMLNQIVNEGVWAGSDLMRYAGINGQVQLVIPEKEVKGKNLSAALIMPAAGAGPDLLIEEPVAIADEALVFSPIAVFQALVQCLDDPGIELLDRSLRYLYSYFGAGVVIRDPATARHLANRAWQEAQT
jgi:hypothetical protein